LRKLETITLGVLPLLLLSVLLVDVALADVVPTNHWVHFYGSNSTLNGNPLPIGAIIDAYDADGVHCGRDIVRNVGQYGFMPVYGDDEYADGDQGAEAEGEVISLKLNGVDATLVGPDDPIWVENGFFEVNLGATINIDVDLVTPPNDFGTPDEYVDYSFDIENTGDGIDLYNLSAVSAGGWTVEVLGGPSTSYLNSGESVSATVRVYVPSDAQDLETDDMTLTVTSQMDPSVSANGTVTTTVIITAADDPYDPIIPGVFSLEQNYPNPFNPVTRIEFTLDKAMKINLSVYNVIGQKVKTLASGRLPIGNHVLEWDGTDESGGLVSSGIYFYRLTTDNYARTRKMMLMK
jgi:hypothetical protein